MKRTFSALMVGVGCCWGLLACDPGGTGEQQNPELLTLQLNRLDTGDLEFCEPQDDGTEVCQTLPYDGDCVIIEIDVDPATGTTCERCILADGTVRDNGCQDTHIGCVLVTLPEPDCVVCAYVNGAIVFSTCVADDEPQCYTDRDCLSDDGRAGFCVEGQCVYSDGCLSDADCPAGFVCELPPYMDPGGGASSPLPYTGTCVPRDITCWSDVDCPQGFYCESWCYGAEPVDCAGDPNTDCLVAPPECEGVCRPIYNNPCADVLCPVGQHCEVQQVECFTWPCEPIAVCVPDPERCESDLDCGPGMFCRFDACPMMPCTPDYCPPCYGVCMPVEPFYCYSDEECPAGQICSWVISNETDPPVPGGQSDPAPGLWAPGVCVPAPELCARDADCQVNGELGYCVDGVCQYQFDCDQSHAFCDMIPPLCGPGLVNSVINGCYGPCVDPATCRPADLECRVDEDCPEGQACLMYCWASCPPDGSPCTSDCTGVCVPSAPQCVSDLDCVDAAGSAGACVNGVCVMSPTDCFVGGCSGEICADEPLASICIWEPEFACYQDARCERQSDGRCGWTMSDELRACLDGV